MNTDKPIELPKESDRVFITQFWLGLTTMQVCVLPEATDEEILAKCNKDNPAGTSNGWGIVLNTKAQLEEHGFPDNCLPVPCKDCAGRLHKVIVC